MLFLPCKFIIPREKQLPLFSLFFSRQQLYNHCTFTETKPILNVLIYIPHYGPAVQTEKSIITTITLSYWGFWICRNLEKIYPQDVNIDFYSLEKESRLFSSKQFNKQVLSLWWPFIKRATWGESLAHPWPLQFAAKYKTIRSYSRSPTSSKCLPPSPPLVFYWLSTDSNSSFHPVTYTTEIWTRGKLGITLYRLSNQPSWLHQILPELLARATYF